MATYEKTKHEQLMELREKRIQKKQAQIKRKHKRCIAALAILTVAVAVVPATFYNASAKEITITEINEFEGTNESKKVKTRSDNVEEVLEEHGLDISEADRLNVPVEKPVSDNEDIVIKRGKRVKIKNGDSEEIVTVTKADITDALVEAGYIPGEYDRVSSNGDSLANADTIELVSISHTDEVVKEEIQRGIEYVDDPDLPQGEEQVVDEGQNGIKEISHKVTYQNGWEAAREVTGETITLEAKNKIIARGTATPVPQKTSVDSSSIPEVKENTGTINGYKYKRKITMTATAYSTSPSENGGYTVSAMGNPLGYGIAAVDPNVVPLGSKVYVTSADGSWSYGVASAEDTGGAIKGNKIDLCYNTNANAFGRRSCVVYILE